MRWLTLLGLGPLLKLLPQVLRLALRPARVLGTRPANKEQPKTSSQETDEKDEAPTKNNAYDAHFATKRRETTRPIGRPSTSVPLFAPFAEEARQQEGAS